MMRLARARGLSGAAAKSWANKRLERFEHDSYVPRTKKVREIGCRKVRRDHNADNPLALGSKVFDWDRKSIRDWDPNSDKRRGIDVLAAAYLIGAIQLSDFDAKTARRIERAAKS